MKKIILGICIISALYGISPVEAARSDIIRELSLDRDQVIRLHRVRKDLKGRRLSINVTIRRKRSHLNEELMSQDPNDDKIDQLTQELDTLNRQRIRVRVMEVKRIRKHLTPEQRRRWREMRRTRRKHNRGEDI